MITVNPNIFANLNDNQCGVLATSIITDMPIKNVVFIEGQQVGDAVDTLTRGRWLLDGKKVDEVRLEAKHDKASVTWGNIFGEIEQTFDDKNTWQRSGLPLVVDQADIFAPICYGHKGKEAYIFTFNPKKLYITLLEANFPQGTTGYRKNGNKPGSYARGWRIPFREISRFYELMIKKFGSFHNFYNLTKCTLERIK